ncbi:MAG: preprotein translocase subunit SecG [Candidatus Dormibacteraceae bacterium]
MQNLKNAIVIIEVVVAVLLGAAVLAQTPKANGLGGTLGGGDSGFGGGYRTRRGLERQLYYTTWVLSLAFLACAVTYIYLSDHSS